MVKDANIIQTPAVKKDKSGPEPIIIPIILKMAEFDHKVCQKLLLLLMAFHMTTRQGLTGIAQKLTLPL